MTGEERRPAHNVTGCPGYNGALWTLENSPGVYTLTKAYAPLTAGTVKEDAMTCLPLSSAGRGSLNTRCNDTEGDHSPAPSEVAQRTGC